MKTVLSFSLLILAILFTGCELFNLESVPSRCNPCGDLHRGTFGDRYTSYNCQKEGEHSILTLVCECENDFKDIDLLSSENSTYLSSTVNSLFLTCENSNVEFPNMSNLECFTNYGSEIPKSIGKSTSLKDMIIYGETNFPVELYNCVNLEKLRFEDAFNENLSLDNFSKLKELKIYDSETLVDFNQMLPNSIKDIYFSRCTNLKTITFQNSTPLPNLEAIEIPFHQFQEFPSSILKQENLKVLEISAPVPDSIGNLINLQILRLQYSSISTINDWIGNLNQLISLDLSNNQITSIDASIGNLTELFFFNISSNQLTNLPTSISNLTELYHWDISGNQLTSLPSSIGNLSNLDKLYLSYNQLSSIPTTIGDCSNLRILHIKDNQLQSIPEEIGQLNKLNFLHLDGNQLTTLPVSIANLNGSLVKLYLEGNNFSEEEKTNIRALLPDVDVYF